MTNRELVKTKVSKGAWVFITCFCLFYLFLSVLSLSSYGLTWDAWEYYYGDKNLAFLTSFDKQHLDFLSDTVAIHQDEAHPNFYDVTQTFKDNDIHKAPHLIWPMGHTLSSVTKYIFFANLNMMDPIDAHHMAPVILVTLMLLLIFLFMYQQAGLWPAIISVMVVAIYPRFWAHSHNNVKDAILVVFFTLSILSFYLGTLQKRPWLIYLSALVLGMALATKANAFFIALICGPWFVYMVWWRYRQSLDQQDGNITGVGGDEKHIWDYFNKELIIALACFPVICMVVMILCWPYMWFDFPRRLLLYFQSLVERGAGGSAGFQIIPLKYFFFTMPPAVFACWVFGLLVIAWNTLRKKRLSPLYLLLLLWLIVPVLRVCLPGARDFDGIRHWLEFIPALAMICGIGVGQVIQAIQEKYAFSEKARLVKLLSVMIVLLLFFPTFLWNVRNHPHQVVYFNAAIGGLRGAQLAQLPEATDYWGNSYREGMTWLNENVAEEKPVLFVGVAEHIVYYSYQIWLNKNITLLPAQSFNPQTLAAIKRPIYVMYITRPDWYKPWMRNLPMVGKLVHQIEVDGGTILEIYRLR